jgi:hypothetical protein
MILICSYHILNLFADGELNVLDDILTEVPEQDDELYNPESEQDKNEKKGKCSIIFVKITVEVEGYCIS